MATRIIFRIQHVNGLGPWVHLHESRVKFPSGMLFATNREGLKNWIPHLQDLCPWVGSGDNYMVCIYRVPRKAIKKNPYGPGRDRLYSPTEFLFDPKQANLVSAVQLYSDEFNRLTS